MEFVFPCGDITVNRPVDGELLSVLAAIPDPRGRQGLRHPFAAMLAASSGELQALALDGKRLCETLEPHAQSIHLLALLDHATGGVRAQLKVPSYTNEQKDALKRLRWIVLEGRLLTGDSMFCLRDQCRHVIDSGADYLIVVKDNQPELKQALEADFSPGFFDLTRCVFRVRARQRHQRRTPCLVWRCGFFGDLRQPKAIESSQYLR